MLISSTTLKETKGERQREREREKNKVQERERWRRERIWGRYRQISSEPASETEIVYIHMFTYICLYTNSVHIYVQALTPTLAFLRKVHQPERAVYLILTLAVWRLDCSSNTRDNIIHAHTPLQSHTHTHSEWRVL